jgi:hypothetical protein
MPAATLWEKLNLKDQAEIVVLNAPDTFHTELRALDGVKVRTRLTGASKTGFVLAFVTRQQEVDAIASSVGAVTAGDAIVWFAYPKGSSKRYQSEISRDDGWRVMGQQGFEPVRMVAIDEDWSAVRFRRAQFIKTMKRGAEHALSKAGRAKAGSTSKRRTVK